MKKKTVALLLALTLVLGVVAGGTIAWLTSTTTPVKNTFTTSDIDITLTESKGTGTTTDKNFKMTPGYTIEKDPKVTVLKGSEACYLFVKVEESENLKAYISYTMDSGWQQLKDKDKKAVDGVYYREVSANATADQAFDVIGYKGSNGTFHKNQVLVNGTVTKTDMNKLDEANATQPTLTFTAYASQLMKNNTEKFDAYDAWLNIFPSSTTNP